MNHTLEEISYQNDHIRAVAINREHTTIIPSGSDYIKNGDIVFFIASKGHQHEIYQMAGKEIFDVKNIMILGEAGLHKKQLKSWVTNTTLKS